MVQIEGFNVICYGGQNVDMKEKYCQHCPIFKRTKYPPCQPSWRFHGYIKRGGKCNVKTILGL